MEQYSPISFDCDANGVAPMTDRRGMLDKMALLHMHSTNNITYYHSRLSTSKIQARQADTFNNCRSKARCKCLPLNSKFARKSVCINTKTYNLIVLCG